MAVDETTRRKIAEHVKRTWRSPGCLICGCLTWELHGHVTLILGDAPGATVSTDALPSLALVCQRCGNTVLVNLVLANALE